MNHTPIEHELETARLIKWVKDHFHKYDGNFEYRRLTIASNRQSKNIRYDKMRIRRLMLKLGFSLLPVDPLDMKLKLAIKTLKKISLIVNLKQIRQIKSG